MNWVASSSVSIQLVIPYAFDSQFLIMSTNNSTNEMASSGPGSSKPALTIKYPTVDWRKPSSSEDTATETSDQFAMQITPRTPQRSTNSSQSIQSPHEKKKD